MTTATCETCGTLVLRDEETGAEAHFDVTYRNCGVEGELTPLADHIDGTATFAESRRSHLRVVR